MEMITINKRLLTSKYLFLTLLFVFGFLNFAAAENSESTNNHNISKVFKVCPFNVDGLPKTISILGYTININEDGLEEEGAIAIGQYIANSDIDVFALSEDFDFHPSLKAKISDEKYTFGTYRGAISASNLSGLKVNTDGLEFLTKQPFSFSQESWTAWNKTYGTTTNGSDELIKKGYRHYVVDLGDGAYVDFYIMHMDADTSDKDNEARASQWEQLRDDILANHNNRPVIVMGDTNSRYTRDDILGLFINPIEAAGDYEVKDAWIEHCKNGNYPTLGSAPLMVSDLGYRDGEVVDKVLYLNPKKDGLSISSLGFDVDADFDKSDHKPIIVTMMVEGSTYMPAEANNWWRGEELKGNGQPVYIYNVGAGTFIAGKEATVKDINSAYIWNINGNGPSYTFACTNSSQDRIHMAKGGFSWNTSIREGSGASSLNVISSTTTTDRGNAYKLSATARGDTRYFNVDGKSYTAASTAGILNDWLFISNIQKEAYTTYKNLYNKAKDYQKYDLSESLRDRLDNTLDATGKGSYATYTDDTESLNKIITDIDAYLKDKPTGISSTNTANRQGIIAIYGTNGVRRSTLAKGINIVKMANGEIKKINY